MNTLPWPRTCAHLSRRLVAGFLLPLLLVTHGGTVMAAQDTSSVSLGDSILTYTSDWELLGEDGENVTLQYESTAYALFDYSVIEDSDTTAGDPAELISQIRIELLASQEIIDNIRLAERGELPDGTVWELYTMDVNDRSIFYLAAANVDLAAGADIVTSLATPLEDIIAAHFAVISGITVDGVPTLIANIPSDELLAAAWIALEEPETQRPPVPPAGPAG